MFAAPISPLPVPHSAPSPALRAVPP